MSLDLTLAMLASLSSLAIATTAAHSWIHTVIVYFEVLSSFTSLLEEALRQAFTYIPMDERTLAI